MSRSTLVRRTFAALTASGTLAAVGLAASVTGSATVTPAAAQTACPPGYTSYADHVQQESAEKDTAGGGADALRRAVDAAALEEVRRGGSVASGTCLNNQKPETPGELALMNLAREIPRLAPLGKVDQGAFANAVGQKGRMQPASVPGTQGHGAPYGQGPLIVDDPAYPSVNGLGLRDNSARVDAFAVDPQTQRLFAAVSSAGVYTSDDLGLHWRPIGDRLPSTVVGSVGYLPGPGKDTGKDTGNGLVLTLGSDKKADRAAEGGRLVALTGEPTYGASSYTGFGAYYTENLGQALAKGEQPTWAKAKGLPDGALGFTVAVDPTNPDVVYAGTSLGLYRSDDGGLSYQNVALPTGATKAGGQPCTGVMDLSARPDCVFANMVTSVVVQAPGGTTNAKGGRVVAAVGWRGGMRKNADGSVQSPSNGIYASDTGVPGSFKKMNDNTVDRPDAFTEQVGIGRIALGAATGPQQDHGYLYALVQDARLLNGGLKGIDPPVEGSEQPARPKVCDPVLGACPLDGGTVLEGLYVSKDFGSTWTRVADDNQIARNPAAGSSLVGLGSAIGYEPGVQGWYNLWVQVDPTVAFLGGPTRVAFGLEEVWENEYVPGSPNVVDGVGDNFKVIGRYFAGSSCQLLSLGLPTCPTNRSPQTSSTTHPDQHAGLFLPVDPKDMSKGVHLIVGNDGGAYRQTLTPSTADDTKDDDGSLVGVNSGDFDNGHWGRGANQGFDALLPYHATMAKDGTVYAGLQDNGHLKTDPAKGLKRYEVYGGDGFFSAVDPDNSKIAYEEYTAGGMRVTTNGGTSWTALKPPITSAQFSNPFVMDPRDAKHLLTAGREVVERLGGPNGGWVKDFDLGTAQHPADASAAPSATDPVNRMSAVDLVGDSAYVGFCGTCDILNSRAPFQRGLATNVGGSAPAKAGTSNGWHIAASKGLPNRYITSVAIDPGDPRTVYVALGGYSRRWTPPGTLGDVNKEVGQGHLFVSHDAGESFQDASSNLPDVPATWVALRGPQVLVGTDVGAFASSDKGLTDAGFAPLADLPATPVNAITRSPRNPREIVLATNGRGVWTYTFDTDVVEAPGAAPAPSPSPTPAPAPLQNVALKSWTFDSDLQGWTTATNDPAGRGWRWVPAGNSGGAAGFPAYGDSVLASVTSPAVPQDGGTRALRWAVANDTEDGFDNVAAQWSVDGQTWTTIATVTGKNANFPGFTTRTDSFVAPAGPLQVRFVLSSDDLISAPAYTGSRVDDVTLLK